MKSQTAPTAMAPLVRGAFYLLLLLTLCMISFALPERNSSTRVKTQMHRPDRNPHPTSGGVNEAWVARYNGPENGYDAGVAIVSDGSGNVYVTGESDSVESGADYLTIKYNSSGGEEWVALYDGGFGDAATAIAIDSSGNVYVTGQSWSAKTSEYDYATVKYSADGQQRWVARYDGPANDYDYPTGIAVDNSGNVYVTGISTGLQGDWDCTTVKYNSNGQQEWVVRYDGPAHLDDWGTAIALDKLDNVYVTGGSIVSGIFSEYLTIKYNSSGQQQWVARYHGTEDGNGASGLAIDSSGNIYVTGASFNASNNFDCVTIKYDSTGQETWVARYDGPTHLSDFGYAIAIDNSDNISVTGAGEVSFNEFNYLTIRYNSAGQEQWVAQSDAGGYAEAVATDNLGNTYITGTGSGVASADYATVKYDALGQEQWVAGYNGPGNANDYPHGIAIDGSDNVYVTGASDGAGTNSDCATIKYIQGAAPSPTPTPTFTPSPTATPSSTPRPTPTPRPRPTPRFRS
jgi:Beta-propeller repeat